MDGDGHLDIVVGNEGGQNVVYLNDGAGNFPVRGATSARDGPNQECGDRGHGWRWRSGHRSRQLRRAEHGLSERWGGELPRRPRNFGTGIDSTWGVAVGDIDSDSDLDIVVGNFFFAQSVVYLNDGAGNLPVGLNFGSGSDSNTCVVVGDMDGDSDLDIIAGSGAGQNLVYLNNGSGSFPVGQDLDSGSLSSENRDGRGYGCRRRSGHRC